MLYRENVNADEVAEHIKGLWQSATSMEPVPGKVTRDDVALLRSKLDPLIAKVPATDAEARNDLEHALAGVLARCAVVAVAAGEAQTGHDWLQAAERMSHDDELKALYEIALRSPEKY